MTGFWDRRKQAVAEEIRAEEKAQLDIEAAKSEAALAERCDDDILAELDLPQPELLQSSEAVREFLSSAVPQRLKTRALRRLWTLNPMLANLDGLIDYGEDFTDSATVIENLQTAYQVGKGMLAHVEELARQKTDDAEDAPVETEDQPEHDDAEMIAEAADPTPDAPAPLAAKDPDTNASSIVAMAPTLAEPETPTPTAPRRMRFRFEEPA